MSPAQPQQAASQPYAPPPNDKKAVWSMVLGILSVVCCGLLAGIPAVILGHISHSNIKKSGGALKGEGLAITGLVLGYGSVLVTFVLFPIIAAIAIPSLLKARITANESAAAATVRTVSTAEATYSITYPQSGFAPDLAALGSGPGGTCVPSATSACLLDATLGCSSNWCVKDAYKYNVTATGSPTPNEFVVTATPVSSRTGRKSYCSTSDSIVRSEAGVVSNPVSVETCQTWSPL
jgi:type II secretory pathway pseudopilin PulG